MNRLRRIFSAITGSGKVGEVQIRTITKSSDLKPAQIDQLVDLLYACAKFHDDLDTTKIWPMGTRKDMLEHVKWVSKERGYYFIIALDEDKVVACCSVCIWYGYNYKHAYVSDLYVEEEYRGTGIATKFFEAIEESKGSKPMRVSLNVYSNNEEAKALYERIGFVETCRTMEKLL